MKITTITNYSRFGVLVAALIVYAVIISTLNTGISCDEGFYLMSYLQNQHSGELISDFGSIVKMITPTTLEENIMTYRWERLLLSLLIFPFFAFSLKRWLVNKFDFKMDNILYYSLMLLSCAMTYTFAAPTISYDSIQTFIYLLSFSFLFQFFVSEFSFKPLLLFFSGFISFWGIMNYFPSGIFLCAIVLLLLFLERKNNLLQNTIFFLFGFVVSIVLYHFFIRDLICYANIAYDTIIKVFVEKSQSRHDAGGFIIPLLNKLALFLIYLPLIAGLTFFFRKIKVKKTVFIVLISIFFVFLLLYRKVYLMYAPLFYLPIALLISFILSKSKITKTNIRRYSKTICLICIFTFLPFLAVFGTNQNLFGKMIIFLPFWLINFHILYSYINNSFVKNVTALLLVVLFFAGYVYLGNFSRYHYYYTPRSSKYKIFETERLQSIKLSQYQLDYYQDVCKILIDNGAKQGDKYLAFGENQMAVFLMGGYITGKLSYHWFQYHDFAKEAPRFFILYKNEEQNVIELLKNANWDFPQKYERIEMRKMSENMDENKYKTIIYVPKNNF